MKLTFNYNIKNNSEYLNALKFHNKKKPNTYEFKKAYDINGNLLNDMTAVYEKKPLKELNIYKSNKYFIKKKQQLMYNYLNKT